MADDMDVGDCSSDGSCGGDDELMGGTPIAGVKVATTTLTEETLMALQQFSIVIGVALMVGILFFLMIAVEQTFEWLGTQISKLFGGTKSADPEDPAALVGSFKRYKN